MTSTQIFLYAILALLLLLYLRKVVVSRSIRQYSPKEVRERMRDRNTVLLDVRTDAERRAQLIRGSMHLPLQQLARRLPELEKFKSKEIICYCRSGNRSLTAALLLRKQGFTSASMRGGIVEWKMEELQ